MASKTKQVIKAWGGVVRSNLSNVTDTMLHALAGGIAGLSREFFELIKAVGEAKSKQEEDRIVRGEVRKIKSELAKPSPVSPTKQ
jgi:hypothetical protein